MNICKVSSYYVLFGLVAGGIRKVARNPDIGIKRGAKAVVRSWTDIFDGVMGLMAIALEVHAVVSIEKNDDIISKYIVILPETSDDCCPHS